MPPRSVYAIEYYYHFWGKSVKRVWFDLHRWVGLKLSILLSFVLITGTLATLSHEIDWLIDPARRVLPPVAVERYDWQAIKDAAEDARPGWAIDWIAAPRDPWFAVEIVARDEEGALRRLFVHPSTHEVQGEGGWVNAQRILRDSHRRLMIFHPMGIVAVSSLSILLLLSLVSGLVIYKKFWRGFFRKPRTKDSRTLWGDLHRLGGLWSLWFVFVIALTSLWYLVETAGGMAGWRIAPPPEKAPHAASARAQPGRASLTEMARAAEAALPGLKILEVYPGHFASEPTRFQGQTGVVLVRDRANRVEFSVNGEILAVADARDLSAMQRIGEMADPLHFGTFGGLATRILYFVFGAILSAMSLSGVYIFSARIRNAQAKAAQSRRPLAAPALGAAE